MNKKYLIGIGVIIVVAAAAYLFAGDKKSSTMEYRNEELGFALTLPSQSWQTRLGNDPHFYATEACKENFATGCQGFEIQGWLSVPSEGQMFTAIPSFIKGATLKKADAHPESRGWRYEYDVMFPGTKKGFTILASDESVEDILKSFELIYVAYSSPKMSMTFAYPFIWGSATENTLSTRTEIAFSDSDTVISEGISYNQDLGRALTFDEEVKALLGSTPTTEIIVEGREGVKGEVVTAAGTRVMLLIPAGDANGNIVHFSVDARAKEEVDTIIKSIRFSSN